ncbi:MAG: helix-turn-helix domain-containing protein [Limisphaerales bacterium]
MNVSPPLPANADALDSGSRSAPHRAAQFMADRDGDLPVWVRAPKRGHEFYSGCSRAKLYEWAAKGFIRSVSIREPGRIKGVRLFHLSSILAFIEQCEAQGNSDQNNTGK